MNRGEEERMAIKAADRGQECTELGDRELLPIMGAYLKIRDGFTASKNSFGTRGKL